jgi:cell wall-associated NlpC family hydrolase
MRTSSRARHAKPAATRTTLRTGLTAALLPVCLAVPAVGVTALAAPAAASTQAAAYVGIAGPNAVVTPGLRAVNVSLQAAGRPVPGARLQLQVATSRGWAGAGTVTTGANGHSIAALRFGATTRVRAVSAGTPASAPDISREMLVRVSRPAAARLGTTTRAAAAAGGFRAGALRVALAQRGKPYRYGSTGPSSFDCSGLVNYAFRSVGKAVPRTSSQLRAWTKPVSRAAAQPGDLVFSPGHVGIYVSPGVMVDAPNSGGRVSARKIYARNYTIGRVV